MALAISIALTILIVTVMAVVVARINEPTPSTNWKLTVKSVVTSLLTWPIDVVFSASSIFKSFFDESIYDRSVEKEDLYNVFAWTVAMFLSSLLWQWQKLYGAELRWILAWGIGITVLEFLSDMVYVSIENIDIRAWLARKQKA